MFPLPALLTLPHARALSETLGQLAASGQGRMVLDAAGVQALDTAGLAVLLEAKRRAQAAQRPFELMNVPAKLADLMDLYGVAGWIGQAA